MTSRAGRAGRSVAAWLPPLLVVPAVVAGAVAVSQPKEDQPELRAISPMEVGTTWVYDVFDHGKPSGTHTKQVTGQAALDADTFDAITLASHYDQYPGGVGETGSTVYLAIDDDAVMQRSLFVNHENLAVEPPAPAYQLPLTEGSTWDYDGAIGDNKLRFTATVAEVADTEVGGRTFEDCVHTVTKLQWQYSGQKNFNPEYTQEEWACPGWGAVRYSESDPANDVELSEELVAFHGDDQDWYAEPPAEVSGVEIAAGGTEGLDPARSNHVDGELGDTLAWSDLRSAGFDFPPAADDEVMVLAERDGEVSATDLATGAIRWRVRLAGPVTTGPAMAGGQVLVPDARKNLWSLDLADGTARWVHRFDDIVSAAPLVTDGVAVVATDDRDVTGLSLADGSVGWRSTRSTAVPFAPALAGDLAVVADASGEVTAYDPDNGHEVWSHALDGGAQVGPAASGDRVVVGDDTGVVYALDATSGDLAWERRTVFYPGGAFAVSDDTVVAVGDNVRLDAWSLADGDHLWDADLDSTYAPPLVVGDQAVTIAREGRVVTHDLASGEAGASWAIPISGGTGKVDAPVGLVADALVVDVDHDQPGLESGLYAYPVAPAGDRGGVSFETTIRKAGDGAGGAAVLAGDTMFFPGFDQAVYRVDRGGKATKLFQADGVVPGITLAGDVLLAQKDEELRAYAVDGDDPLWTYPAPTGYPGQVAVANDDTVFVPLNQEGLAAVDLRTGEERWRQTLTLAIGASAPLPLPDGDVVYGGAALGRYDGATGKQEWTIYDGVTFGPPAYDDGVVYALVSRALGESGIGAYDAETGQELWFHANGAIPIGLGPAAGDGGVVVLDDTATVTAYDGRSGEQLWTFGLRTTLGGRLVVEDGVVYVSEGGRKEDIYQRDYRISAHDLRTGAWLGAIQPPGSQFTILPSVSGSDGALLAPASFTGSVVMIARPR